MNLVNESQSQKWLQNCLVVVRSVGLLSASYHTDGCVAAEADVPGCYGHDVTCSSCSASSSAAVSSWALARLSTAMARNTFSSVSFIQTAWSRSNKVKRVNTTQQHLANKTDEYNSIDHCLGTTWIALQTLVKPSHRQFIPVNYFKVIDLGPA